jgi:signal peptidase I
MNNKAWTISVTASILLVVGVFAVLFGSGYRIFVVQTPSMGTVAPVGTLVAVRAQATYHVGDIVTYERNTRSYTHRIVDITEQGFITKGDINGATDALPVQPNEIVGLVTFHAPYVGFLVQGLPWIILGWAIVYGVTLLPRVRPSWRWQIRFIGWSLVVSIVALWTRPWVNLVMMGYLPSGDGVAMHLVNTGVFPVKVLGTVLQSGQDAVVQQNVADASGHYTVIPQLALTAGWFLPLLAICLTPMLASLLIGVEEEVPAVIAEPAVTTRRFRLQYRRIAPIALTVTASIFAVALVLQMSTNAAFAASIKNSTNTAGTRTWFSCKNAETGTSGALFAWDLTSTSNPQSDLTPNGPDGTLSNNGSKSTNATTDTTSLPCRRDTTGSLMFNGGTCIYINGAAIPSTQSYSEEVWFRASNPNTLNGKLMGFASNTTPANQGSYDRHIYLDPTGRVVFGVYLTGLTGQRVVSSPVGTNYANSQWHHVVATSGPTGALGTITLYVDGIQRDTRPDVANQDPYNGYWMVGCGMLNNWMDATGTARAFPQYFTGNLRLAAVYDRALTATEVNEHWLAGQP